MKIIIIMFICICNGITDGEIRNALAAKKHDTDMDSKDKLDYLKDKLDFDFCFGKCQPILKDMCKSHNP